MNAVTNFSREAEHRNVTVMFADISGFTSMSEKLDPEEMISIINDCFRMMGSIVEENGGTIDKFIGDCIMAVFGAPVAIEEAPRNTLNAAIEICNQIEAYNQSKNLKNTLGVHVGINTGRVIAGPVGSGGKQEYTVMGDPVNVASRLKDLSSSGEIFVGHETYKYTKQYFNFSSLDMLALKGKESHVKAWKLLTREETVHRSPRLISRHIGSPLVGRRKEMELLISSVLKILSGRGAIINITGEAGIGKSRLIAELRGQDEIRRITYLEGRALSFGKSLSFYPIIDILRKWASIEENDTEKQAYLKLKNSVSGILPEDADDVFPFIATMMGMQTVGNDAERLEDIRGASLERMILKSLETLLIQLAINKPLVIVLEDIHWADRSSIDLFEMLYRLSENHPVLFINLMRPGHDETGERILKTIRTKYPGINTEIILHPLNAEYSDQLINNLLNIEGFPAKLKNDIIRQTGGNPYFMEEVVRSFIDEGVIVQKDEAFEVTEKVKKVVIPSTIFDVLMARMDRLDEKSKSVLKTASVIGRNFYYRILKQVYQSPDDLDAILKYLVSIQFLRKEEHKTELRYLFRHALAQEAAYTSILETKRRQLHLKTARVIETQFAEKLPEFCGLLAMHYLKAKEFSQAETYLVKAGEMAVKSSASNEAIHYYSEALKIYQNLYGDRIDEQKVIRMQINIGMALINKGKLDEAVAYYMKTSEYYGLRISKSTFSLIYNIIMATLQLTYSLNFPARRFNRIPDEREEEIISLSNNLMGSSAFLSQKMALTAAFKWIKKLCHYNPGKFNPAAQLFLTSIAMYSYGGISYRLHKKALNFLSGIIDREDPRTMLHYNFSKAVNTRFEGNWNCQDYDDSLVDKCLKMGITLETNWYILFMYFIDLGQGRFEAARRKSDKLAEIGHTFDNDTANGWNLISRAKLNLAQRNPEQALIDANLHIEYCKKTGDQQPQVWGYGVKAHALLLMADYESAENALQIAYDNTPGRKNIPYNTSYVAARFFADLIALEQALKERNTNRINDLKSKLRQTAKEAWKVAAIISDNRMEIYRYTGTFYWLCGKTGKALKWWNKAIRFGTNNGAMPELGRVYSEAGSRLLSADHYVSLHNQINPKQALEKARKIFREYKLEIDLEELNHRTSGP